MIIKCTIKGISPLIQNRFTDAAAAKVSGGSSSVIQSGDRGTPREIAEQKRYLDSNGKPVIPGPNIFSMVIQAGTFVKVGKSKLTTMKSSLVPAGLSIIEMECPITPHSWEVDSRSVVIPSTGGRIMCHRPRFDEWACTFSIDVDESMFAEKLVRELIDLAGQRIGLGDFRPARKGPFGRFRVDQWKTKE